MKRFWDKVDVRGPDECWEWQAAKNGGYGIFRLNGKNVRAHRYVVGLATPSQSAQVVMHRCDNPSCVNPAHLLVGTQHDNIADMVAKSRQGKGSQPLKKGELNGQSKLSDDQVREIRRRYASGNVFQYQLAEEYGVTQPLISQIILRKAWKHL